MRKLSRNAMINRRADRAARLNKQNHAAAKEDKKVDMRRYRRAARLLATNMRIVLNNPYWWNQMLKLSRKLNTGKRYTKFILRNTGKIL